MASVDHLQCSQADDEMPRHARRRGRDDAGGSQESYQPQLMTTGRNLYLELPLIALGSVTQDRRVSVVTRDGGGKS